MKKQSINTGIDTMDGYIINSDHAVLINSIGKFIIAKRAYDLKGDEFYSIGSGYVKEYDTLDDAIEAINQGKTIEDFPVVDAGQTIRDIRTRAGYSQQELSTILGIPKRTIEDWERGARKPAAYMPWLIRKAIMWRDDKSPRFVKEGHYWTLYIGMDGCGSGNLEDLFDMVLEYEYIIVNDPDEFVRQMNDFR